MIRSLTTEQNKQSGGDFNPHYINPFNGTMEVWDVWTEKDCGFAGKC